MLNKLKFTKFFPELADLWEFSQGILSTYLSNKLYQTSPNIVKIQDDLIRIYAIFTMREKNASGGPCRIRTCDQSVMSRVL